MKKNLICISGKMGSGKDTIGKIIQYLVYTKNNRMSYESFCLLEERWYNPNDWEIKKFATKLKQTASLLTGVPVEMWENQEFKKEKMPAQWEMTYREFLQKLGTEAMRNGLHTNVWVNALFADYKTFPKTFKDKSPVTIVVNTDTVGVYPNWIITDLRFPNELEAVKSRGGITIRVNRNTNPCVCVDDAKLDCLVECSDKKIEHFSETALDHITDWDYVINNNGTIQELIEKIKQILIKEEII